MNEIMAEPLVARVYRILSEDIVTGRIAPGTPLIQKQLAARFEVSRTPIRDVLTQLTADGLAQLISGKGCFVSNVSRDAVTDVYAVRAALEEPVFRTVFGKHTALQLHQLRILATETLQVSPENGEEFYEASLQFHQLLMAPCPGLLTYQNCSK
ncbi:GntR family transcriptional regulator [Paeniglutamicibacter cryotolerans]|uniref:DNA-binding GntR family transcriptional regulator n=1 Tax=Paeniglutamicibacter cryotolerans TaxID=670079 RepID=A0A839QL37_9MICC|nr:GntR family transcriptional regulator [Paeniglutamicibacter cryotolerans]MBB2994736.1 DNA-binding GntR family transcriptional regulator [Paeniglutamicibacter cryotolerans]